MTPEPNEQRRSSPPGRPRALDDAKRREICALVAGGLSLREAARYVRCGASTIRREADRNPEFHDQLRRSEMYAQLSPLRAMQKAVATHWRAAAWMLERAYPRRFARRDPASFGPQQARRLLNEVLDILSSEIAEPFLRERIEKRLRATFEYSIRAACDRRRSAGDLRRAISFFEQKESRRDDPLAQFGFSMPDVESLMRAPFPAKARPSAATPSDPPPSPGPAGKAAVDQPSANEPPAADPLENPASMADVAQLLRDAFTTTPTPAPAPPAPQWPAEHESASQKPKTPE